ncbi:hypothetical protein QJS10_CPB17g01053 [Acorus calamus]|uniref:Cytochrome c-552/DMSO reductase-like haem-binding domain-containing protein n=1 Tax=Acorus calamus TaxID=4465 RepID=A0AAV9CS58_ACOCL|nr:hypothetical protein QJS10_CPB17g01053 [Acorus calamus]
MFIRIAVAFFVYSAILLSSSPSTIRIAESHEEGEEGHGSCESGDLPQISADYRPGIVTVDGNSDEWSEVDGVEMPLLPALDFDDDKAYGGGRMTVKALHDGRNMYFMLQVDGEFAYVNGDSKKCPSVALMFQIGETASYHRMGGCEDMPGTCTSKTCKGHEVDIMHFSIGNAIPGRLYGGNPIDNSNRTGSDSFGHLVDLYAWNPHCRYIDGVAPSGKQNDSVAQNDWQGSWWHSTLTLHSGFVAEDSPYAQGGQKGTYYFEFSRPLRTMDRHQQDAQFVIGQSSKFAVAFWYPVDGKPWRGSQHYSVSCDWLSLEVASGAGFSSSQAGSGSSWGLPSAMSLILSFVAFCVSIFVGYMVFRPKSVPFTPIDDNL